MLTIKFILKTVVDYLIALLIFLPAMLFSIVAGILIKKDSPGPIFFRQKRFGKNNRIFELYKFRTMYQDAPQERSQLQSQNEADGFLFKMKLDPRETPFGRRLRNTGLDEIPQIFNVLRREMSLVGPRPLPQKDVDLEKLKQNLKLYHQWQIRKSVKPGITGLWQINPGDHSFAEMLKFDEQYVEKYSLWLDFKIMFGTLLIPVKVLLPKLFRRARSFSKSKEKKIALQKAKD